ncbi:hypothetical protein [Natrialba sp. INN-245]|uniref:hypothetical protein n=1 Tax=Natrialba sp. INN-245 TaxID=2690967 RepID=UPI00131119DF|nr:hypothetical protein [Natrialba sp. INN-245]MWV41943.1 hypothetical protein [Natrialba sp. INN-245]
MAVPPRRPTRWSRRLVRVAVVVCLVGFLAAIGSIGVAAASAGTSYADTAGAGPEVPLQVDEQCDPAADDVVVRFGDDNVVSGSLAGDCPADPYVHVEDSSETLTIDDGVVRTESGEKATVDGKEIHQFDGQEPDLLVSDGEFVNSSLVVDDDGFVVLEDDGDQHLRVDDDRVRFDGDPRLSLEIVEATSEVAEGESLDVTTEVEYLGYHEFDGTVTVNMANESGPVEEFESGVSLQHRESTTTTESYETKNGDAPVIDISSSIGGASGSVGVAAPPDNASVDVEEAKIVLDVADHNRPAEGDDLEVTAELERIGDIPRDDYDDQFLMEFFVDGDRDGDWSRVSSRAVDPVAGSSSTTETFTYSTSEGDGPDVDVGLTVFDGDISDDPEWHNRVDHRTVPVVSEDAYKQEAAVNLTSWNAPEEGNDLELTADIEHDDLPDGSHTVPVVFYANGETIEERSVALSGPGSDSVSESFTYETTQGDAPDVTAGVRTPGDRQSESVRVFGSGFQVEILETNAPVNESERMQATVAIQNIGDIADAQDVRLIVDRAGDDPDNRLERRQDNASINLGVGETTTEQFSYRTGSNEPPVVDLIARSENDEDRVTATVRPDAPRFEVTEIELPESAEAGEEIPITAEITNEGAAGGTQYIEIETADELVHIDRSTLPPVENTTVTFTDTVPEGEETVEYAVSTENHTATESLSITGSTQEPTEAPADPDETESDDEPADDDEPAGTAEPSEPSEAVEDPESGISWLRVAVGAVVFFVLVVMVLLVTAATLLYRNDPENFPPDGDTIRAHAEAATSRAKTTLAAVVTAAKNGDVGTLKSILGLGPGTLVVQNELPRAATVRVRCQTADDTVVLEDMELGPDERRDLGSLPNVSQFKVGAGVDDITAHEEVFQGVSGDIGVVLRTDGILIANHT